MDSLLFAILGQALVMMLGIAFAMFVLVRFFSKRGKGLSDASKRTRKNKNFVLAIVSSVLALVLLSVLLIGQSFFNNPQYTVSGVTTTTWPYDIERIFLAITMLSSLYFWVKYLQSTKGQNGSGLLRKHQSQRYCPMGNANSPDPGTHVRLGKTLLVSLLIQIALYGHIVYEVATIKDDWDGILLPYEMLLYAFLGLVNIGLLIAYYRQCKRYTQPMNLWVALLMVLMLCATLVSPWVLSAAYGECTIEHPSGYGCLRR